MLIQIGGLGVIACTFSFFLILKKRITLRERIIIQETYNMDTLGGMVKLIIKIIQTTFLIEGIGACFFALQFVPEYGFWKGVAYSIFHAVSAFCNAGIDILGDSSFMKYVSNPFVNFTTMGLIIVSGLGFTVLDDIVQNLKKVKRKELKGKRVFTKLSLHSKIVITMTVTLIVLGTVSFFLLEYTNPNTMGEMNMWEKFLASAFHSVSTRTAGFATVSQSELTQGSKLITCLLMFVGGSPAGTAGGVKTTTVAMLILTCIAFVEGKRDTECFGRRISEENMRSGLMVVMFAFGVLVTGTVALCVVEPKKDFLDLLYEATSALGTVGLSADLTPKLKFASKWIIMLIMYIGRIGPVTLALVFGKGHTKDNGRELPMKNILVG